MAFLALTAGFLAIGLMNFIMFAYFNCFVLSAYNKLISTLAQTSLNDNGRLLDAQTIKDIKIEAIKTYKLKYNCLTNWKLMVSSILVLAMGGWSFVYNESFYSAIPMLFILSILRGGEVYLSFEMRSWNGEE